MRNTIENKKSEKFEAYGVRGMNSKQWKRVFKNQEVFETWLDSPKNAGDVEVYGTRDIN